MTGCFNSAHSHKIILLEKINIYFLCKENFFQYQVNTQMEATSVKLFSINIPCGERSHHILGILFRTPKHGGEVIRMLNLQTSSLGFELTRFLASLQTLDWICFSEAQARLPKHTCKIHSHQVRHLPVGFLILLSPDIHLQIINSPN